MKEELFNPTVPRRKRIERQTCSEKLASLLKSELADSQVLTFRELGRFQYILLPLRLDFHSLYAFFGAGAVAAIIHSKLVFAGCSRKLHFPSNWVVLRRTTKDISTPRWMSTVIIRIELDIGNN